MKAALDRGAKRGPCRRLSRLGGSEDTDSEVSDGEVLDGEVSDVENGLASYL